MTCSATTSPSTHGALMSVKFTYADGKLKSQSTTENTPVKIASGENYVVPTYINVTNFTIG